LYRKKTVIQAINVKKKAFADRGLFIERSKRLAMKYVSCRFLMLFGQNKTGIGLMIRAGNLKGDRPFVEQFTKKTIG